MSNEHSRSATVLTVINLKGGVGKTATAFQVAGAYHERGVRVLLVDCDAQANLTSSFLAEPDGQHGVEALFDPAREPDAAGLIRRTPFELIDLIPATVRLSHYDLPDGAKLELRPSDVAVAPIEAGCGSELTELHADVRSGTAISVNSANR